MCPEEGTTGNDGNDSGTDHTACVPEITECIYDSECLGCLSDALPDGCTAAETDASTCDAVSEMMCCLYGANAICLNNELLVTYTGMCVPISNSRLQLCEFVRAK